ncbi:MAG: homoserine kinase [Calditrichaceae bacterium]
MQFSQLNKKEIRAFAPASVANVGCGFDIFGFALHVPGDEVYIKAKNDPGIKITKISGDDNRLPKDASLNTAGASLQAMMDFLSTDFGIEMEIHKKMPIGSGLGSSAASSVASVFALNEMLNEPLDKQKLLEFAIAGEKISSGDSIHLDNITACLYGGFILVRSKDPIDIVKIPTPKGLHCAVLHPQIEIKTEASRRLLRKQITLEKAVTQWGNVAGTVSALFTSNFELLKRSLDDVVVVPDRAELIPKYYQIYEAAMSMGAIGCSISGSGPSVLSDLYISAINDEGPKVIG